MISMVSIELVASRCLSELGYKSSIARPENNRTEFTALFVAITRSGSYRREQWAR